MEKRPEKLKWMILDVDGTMTDGGIYLDNHGVETKKFSIKDGAGILLARQAGIEPVILTGRESVCVQKRAAELGIRFVFQNVRNKREFLERFLKEQGSLGEEAAYIGDDLNDLPPMRLCRIAACPADAAKQVKDFCSWTARARGGEGVVREFVEHILSSGRLEACARELWG